VIIAGRNIIEKEKAGEALGSGPHRRQSLPVEQNSRGDRRVPWAERALRDVGISGSGGPTAEARSCEKARSRGRYPGTSEFGIW
jgi:hypothetical protein